MNPHACRKARYTEAVGSRSSDVPHDRRSARAALRHLREPIPPERSPETPDAYAIDTCVSEQTLEAIQPRIARNASAWFDAAHSVIMLYSKYGQEAPACAVTATRVLISPQPMLNDSSL